MLLRDRKIVHKKNTSSGLGTGRSKKTSQQKTNSREKSKDKSKDKARQTQILKRMSFQSPDRKEDANYSKNFSLLNFMLFKEKMMKNSPSIQKSNKMSRDQFAVL